MAMLNRMRWLIGMGALTAVLGATAAHAQDAIELRTVDGLGVEQTRFSISSGAQAEVKLAATFNAQLNPVVGLAYMEWKEAALPSAAPSGYGRIAYSTGRFWISEGGAWVDLGTVRSIGTGSGLTGGPITSSGTISIADGGVTSAHIADGTISLADLGQNSAASGQLFKWNGSGWTVADDLGAGGGVPPGFSILGNTTATPTGYAYTGDTLVPVNANSWVSKSAIPVGTQYAAAAALGTKVYLFGGFNDSIVGDVREYDPATDTWALKQPLPSARCQAAAAALGSYIYVFGGTPDTINPLTNNDRYDPATDSWSTAGVDAMPAGTGRRLLAAAAMGNRIYVVGGDNFATILATTQEFNPAAAPGSQWAAKADMNTARAGLALVPVAGKLYAMGGYDIFLLSLMTTEQFDPDNGPSGTWSSAWDSMPAARYYAAAGAINNKIYLVGGMAPTNNPVKTVYEFDPAYTAGGNWTSVVPMPTARGRLAAAVLFNKLYALGGGEGMSPGIFYAQNEVYTPPGGTLFVHKKN